MIIKNSNMAANKATITNKTGNIHKMINMNTLKMEEVILE